MNDFEVIDLRLEEKAQISQGDYEDGCIVDIACRMTDQLIDELDKGAENVLRYAQRVCHINRPYLRRDVIDRLEIAIAKAEAAL